MVNIVSSLIAAMAVYFVAPKEGAMNMAIICYFLNFILIHLGDLVEQSKKK